MAHVCWSLEAVQTAHIDTISLSRCHMSDLGRSSLVFLLIAGDQSAADFSHSELVCAQIRLLPGEFFLREKRKVMFLLIVPCGMRARR